MTVPAPDVPVWQPDAEPDEGPSEPPSILDKAFEVLQAFTCHDRVMTLSEVARASGLPKSTVHRLLKRLLRLNAVERHGEGYKLGLGLVALGAQSLAGLLREMALPYLTGLHRWSGCSVELAVMREGEVVCLERIAATGGESVAAIGARRPARECASGLVMMAFSGKPGVPASDELARRLEGIRREGVARQHDLTGGVGCVAAPVIPLRSANAAVSLESSARAALPPSADNAVRDVTARLSVELRARLIGPRVRWLPPDL